MTTMNTEDDDWAVKNTEPMEFDSVEYRALLSALNQPQKPSPPNASSPNLPRLSPNQKPYPTKLTKPSTLNISTPNSAHDNNTKNIPSLPTPSPTPEMIHHPHNKNDQVQDNTNDSQLTPTLINFDTTIEYPDISNHNEINTINQGDQDATGPDHLSPHSFEKDYLTFTPADQIEVWLTKIEFTIPKNESLLAGINKRLLSFIPTVIAKSKGNILAWDEASDLNPVRDLHTICNTDAFQKYFRYDILPNRKIRGWLRIQVYALGHTFNYIKHSDNIVKNALQFYPIYWSRSELKSIESATPIFLTGISKTINMKQLKEDLIAHTGITFPIDIARKSQVASGLQQVDGVTERRTLSVPVVKISCAKDNVTELKEKFFSSLGTGVAFHPKHQYSALPYIKVMVAWKHGPWSEQVIFNALTYQQQFDTSTTSLEVHHIANLQTEVTLNEESRTLQAHLVSFLVNNKRIVYSADKTGLDKVWITVNTKYVKEYMTYLNTLFTEMNQWNLDYLQTITGCYHRPCWSTDLKTLSPAEQAYLNRENIAKNLTSFPPLPVAPTQNPPWLKSNNKTSAKPTSSKTQDTNNKRQSTPTQKQQAIDEEKHQHNASDTVSKHTLHQNADELLVIIMSMTEEIKQLKKENAITTKQQEQKFSEIHDKLNAIQAQQQEEFVVSHNNLQDAISALSTSTMEYTKAEVNNIKQTHADIIQKHTNKFSEIHEQIEALQTQRQDDILMSQTSLQDAITALSTSVKEYTTLQYQDLTNRLTKMETNMESLHLSTNQMLETSQNTKDKLNSIIEDLNSYSETTNVAIQALQCDTQEHHQSAATILDALTKRVNNIPASDNFRTFERQITDTNIQQAHLQKQIDDQALVIEAALNNHFMENTQYHTLQTTIGYLESKTVTLEKSIKQISKSLKPARKTQPTSKNVIKKPMTSNTDFALHNTPFTPDHPYRMPSNSSKISPDDTDMPTTPSNYNTQLDSLSDITMTNPLPDQKHWEGEAP